MKKTLSILFLIIGIMFSFTLTSCKKKTDYTVGVCQLVQHGALDEATRGFKEALEAKMAEAGKTIYIDVQNAQGDSATCTTIVSKFVNSGYNLIMANATPALQAAVSKTRTIPILGTSVTTYADALEITMNENGSTGINVSGTSDALEDISKQAEIIFDFVPDASIIGILYCSSEANSIYQSDIVEEYLKGEGCTVKIYTFTDSNDINSVCQRAANEVEALYIPTDNTAASNTQIIDSVFREKDIPVFVGDSNMCKSSDGTTGCGVASISVSYYNIGYETGLMAAEILLDGKDISTMPIRYDSNPTKYYNEEILNDLGLTLPDGYTKIGD